MSSNHPHLNSFAAGCCTLLVVWSLWAPHISADTIGACVWAAGNGSWHTASNWDCSAHDGVPTATDAVTIATAGTVTVSINAHAECWSLLLGEAAETHSQKHTLQTTVDNIDIHVGEGGVLVDQSGRFLLGREMRLGAGAIAPLRANLYSEGLITAYGRFWPRNANIHGAVEVDQPKDGGPRGNLQTRGWNIFHGPLTLIDGGAGIIVWDQHVHGSLAPAIAVLNHDFVVTEGSGVSVFFNWAGGLPNSWNQSAISVEGGSLQLHGQITTSGFTQNTGEFTGKVDAQTLVSETGRIDVRITLHQGLELRAPEGTVHENAGMIETGWLHPDDNPLDARTGPGLVISSGRHLINTGVIDMSPMRSHAGNVSNIGGGLITHEVEVNGDGQYILGFNGPSELRVEIEQQGDIEHVGMAWHGEDHPEAALNPHLLGTNHWWELIVNGDDPGSGLTGENLAHLSLPRFNANESKACRFLPDISFWDCRRNQIDVGHVTYANIADLNGDWAVSDFLDRIFSDRYEPAE